MDEQIRNESANDATQAPCLPSENVRKQINAEYAAYRADRRLRRGKTQVRLVDIARPTEGHTRSPDATSANPDILDRGLMALFRARYIAILVGIIAFDPKVKCTNLRTGIGI